MIIAGIGARAMATTEDMVAAVLDCCRRSGVDPAEVGALAGLDRPETVAALRAAAAGLKAEPHVFDAVRLQSEAARCVTHSDRSLAATGVPSVAEAAALAAAGPEGMLLSPRVAYGTVTVALAIGPGGTEV
jgi:cobalamin biosynthesis protein CbiG